MPLADVQQLVKQGKPPAGGSAPPAGKLIGFSEESVPWRYLSSP